MEVKSARVQGFRGGGGFTHLLFPNTLEFSRDQVVYTKRKLMGLGRNRKIISMNRISSVETDEGVFNATIIVQTFGGGTQDDIYIHYVPKAKAHIMVGQISAALR